MKDYVNFEENFDLKVYNDVIKLTLEGAFKSIFGWWIETNYYIENDFVQVIFIKIKFFIWLSFYESYLFCSSFRILRKIQNIWI